MADKLQAEALTQAEALIGRLTVEASKIQARLKQINVEMQEAYNELEELSKEQ